jgi:hypothetical protein
MKSLILAILAVGLFQVNLAAADQYVYADGMIADLDEPTTEVADNTYNAEPYVYADGDIADLDEPTTEMADNTDNNVDSTIGFADGKRVISTNQSAESAM